MKNSMTSTVQLQSWDKSKLNIDLLYWTQNSFKMNKSKRNGHRNNKVDWEMNQSIIKLVKFCRYLHIELRDSFLNNWQSTGVVTKKSKAKVMSYLLAWFNSSSSQAALINLNVFYSIPIAYLTRNCFPCKTNL